MSGGNWFLTRKKAFDLRTISLTSGADTATVGPTDAYTVKVGTPTNDFVVDRVINVTLTAGNDLAITLPNGIFEGQRILINLVLDGGTSTATVTPATANTTATYALTTLGDYCSLEWMNATEGWAYLSEVTT